MNNNKILYYRLIALWAVCEAMLGGIIHGLKIPVSGLVIGSCAVTCISLIGWYYPARGAILKATIIVAVCKMILSPQASFPAYIAVFFQGALGELLFRNKRFYHASCLALAILSLAESGFQRILVLTIVYGNGLWTTIDEFISRLSGSNRNYSFWIGSGYVALHLITGVMVGKWCSGLPVKLETWKQNDLYRMEISNNYSWAGDRIRKKKSTRKIFLIVWVVFLALYIQSYYNIGAPLLPVHVSIKVLLRSLIIVIGWIYIAGPILRKLVHFWLKRKQMESNEEIRNVFDLLPAMRQIVSESLQRSKIYHGLRRLRTFNQMVLVNALFQEETKASVYILNGEIRSGKTTYLMDWIAGRKDVSGILTPVIDGKRYFMEIATGEVFPMETNEWDNEALIVGRYKFSRISFEKAIQILRNCIYKPGWVIIDEIGPLELRGEGFSETLKEILANRKDKCLLVVRESLKEKVTGYFGIDSYLTVAPCSIQQRITSLSSWVILVLLF